MVVAATLSFLYSTPLVVQCASREPLRPLPLGRAVSQPVWNVLCWQAPRQLCYCRPFCSRALIFAGRTTAVVKYELCLYHHYFYQRCLSSAFLLLVAPPLRAANGRLTFVRAWQGWQQGSFHRLVCCQPCSLQGRGRRRRTTMANFEFVSWMLRVCPAAAA